MTTRTTAIASNEGAAETGAGRWMALSGLLFAALLIVGTLASMGSPSNGSSAASIQKWYLDHKGRMNLSALTTLLSVVVGLFFLNYVRSCFRRVEAAGWRSSLFWAGAILFAMSGLLGAGSARLSGTILRFSLQHHFSC